MSRSEPVHTCPDAGQPTGALDRAARNVSTRMGTRRWLLERGAVGAASVATASAIVPAGHAFAAPGRYDSIEEWGVFASTTEALTLTI